MANCYLVFDDKSQEGVVIDPGADGTVILHEIKNKGVKVKYIINTHGHPDHIGANKKIKEATGGILAIHDLDEPMLTDAGRSMAVFMGERIEMCKPDQLLRDGDLLEAGDLKFKVIHTPGHTPGGICLLVENACFSGDTLFARSIGRTDFPGGSYPVLIDSIQNKLFLLDDKVVVYPGHGPATTIGEEKRENPFF